MLAALPISLDKIFNQFVAISLSMTFVLSFGEVIPQAVRTRYGLTVGANFVWLMRILMIICYPITYPIGKVWCRLCAGSIGWVFSFSLFYLSFTLFLFFFLFLPFFFSFFLSVLFPDC